MGFHVNLSQLVPVVPPQEDVNIESLCLDLEQTALEETSKLPQKDQEGYKHMGAIVVGVHDAKVCERLHVASILPIIKPQEERSSDVSEQ